MPFPTSVKLVEVSPRDGLQNEKTTIPTNIKIDFINRLSATGLHYIEVTSFVSPKWVPQLADQSEVFQGITKKSDVTYSVFVPNITGFNNAFALGAKEVALFSTPSEKFSEKNINCSVAENLKRITAIAEAAKKNHVRVRGYISCALGCPYQGDIDPQLVADLAEQLIAMGCYEISLGDTIGVGTAGSTKILLEKILKKIPAEKIAVHFHDTYGQALANIYVALEHGIQVIDSSVSGLGGCPYAKGATGNVATEDVLYLLNGLNIQTGVDLNKLVEVGQFISGYLGRTTQSKTNLAMVSKK